MPKYLTQEFHDEYKRLFNETQPDRPGVSARMQNVVTGGPEGDVTYHWIIEDGKLVEDELGALDDAEFTITMTHEDSVKVQRGDMDPNAAFMQGRMKVSGNMAKLMSLLPLTNSPEYKQLQEQVREVTDF
ncbi:MAG: SCP2 sterol-binding domain-containing protein [Actinomycetota bacterium]